MRLCFGAALFLLVSGCFQAPELPLLSDVDLAENAPESGLLSPDTDAPKTVLQELETVENLPAVEAVLDSTVGKPRRGVLGFFARRGASKPDAILGEVVDPEIVDDSADGGDEAIEDIAPTDAADAHATVAVDLEPKPARKGWFGPHRVKPSRLDQIKTGVMLPFGQIGRACGLRASELGKEVDRFPERGKGYRLYDSDPSTTQPRIHYVTGFKDGCLRQFTASLALLESPLLHEKLLAVESGQAQHSTKADKMFQKIRAQVCRTGRGKICPENRTAAMEKTMAFVTTYERFGGNASWTEILMHNGNIAANSAQE